MLYLGNRVMQDICSQHASPSVVFQPRIWHTLHDSQKIHHFFTLSSVLLDSEHQTHYHGAVTLHASWEAVAVAGGGEGGGVRCGHPRHHSGARGIERR